MEFEGDLRLTSAVSGPEEAAVAGCDMGVGLRERERDSSSDIWANTETGPLYAFLLLFEMSPPAASAHAHAWGGP